MTTRQQQYYLQQMGIDVWLSKENIEQNLMQSISEGVQVQPEAAVAESPDWEMLRQQVSICTQCALHESRTQTVFGVGDPNADWLIIGEAPGAEEDRQGEPFVGRAGKLLNNMLLSMGLKREQVFIANILKCRPPQNRDPKPDEVIACDSFLNRQIEMIRPKMILAVGRIAAQSLLKVDTPISRMRGQRYEYSNQKIPVVVTYHPAYLLRSPREKQKSWQDIQLAMKIYNESL